LIRKVYKKDIPEVMNDTALWNHSFLSVTKHRLYAHYTNPNCDEDDIVLLLAYLDDEIIGYMGVFIDIITIEGRDEKIGWLSTWWVHPKTKGKGIGRSILQTMYDTLEGRIGVSQFTPSAKRVYIKSGYFNDLKKNIGYKFVFRSNLNIVFPLLNPKFNRIKGLLSFTDFLINIPVSLKNAIQKVSSKQKIADVQVEYVNFIDDELMRFIHMHSKNHLSQKSSGFFQWLKANHWVQESPLMQLSLADQYEFSLGAKKFNIYLVKIMKNKKLIGFIVLQRKNHLLKLLFAYYSEGNEKKVSQIIIQHAYQLKIKELVSYDEKINACISSSFSYIYKRNKVKEAIISKVFEGESYDAYHVNFGDGDCSFA